MPAKRANEPKPLPPQIRRSIAKLSTDIGATPKQHAFALNRLSGLSQAESYRRAYDTTVTDYNRVATSAHFVARNAKVEVMLNEGKAQLNVLNASRGQQWRERIDEKLSELVEKKDIAEKDLIAALKLAGSQVHVQAFSKAVDADSAAVSSLREAIQAFSETASATGITIDATFSPVLKSLETWQAVDFIEAPTIDDGYDELDVRSPRLER